jgi:hypothetical protein
MPNFDVKSYMIYWDITKHRGDIQLDLSDNSGTTYALGSAEEMLLLLDVLRNEQKPIKVDRATNILTTSFHKL